MKLPNLNSLPALAKLEDKEIDTLKTIGCYALGFGAVGGIIYFGCKTTSTHASNVSKRKQAEKLERTKADEEIRIAKAKAEADANKYERMRKADEELHRQKIEANLQAMEVKAEMHSDDVVEDKGCSQRALFTSETLNETIAKAGPMPKQLFGDYLHQYDHGFLFSPSNQGKSKLAYQIALNLADGQGAIFDTKEQLDKHVVFYFDMENSRKQIKASYGQHGYVFPDNFKRIHGKPKETEDLLQDIKNRISSVPTGTNVLVVIDTCTAISTKFTIVQEAEKYMSGIKDIQEEASANEVSVTVLTVAHTAQTSETDSLTLDNLAGSKYLGKEADSVFALGKTRLGEDTKMLKMLKTRYCKKPDTVSVLKMADKPYVHFEFVENAKEEEVLFVSPKRIANQCLKGNTEDASTNEQKVVETNILARSENGKVLVTQEEVEKMRQMYEPNVVGYRKVAKIFGISPTLCQQIIEGKILPNDAQ